MAQSLAGKEIESKYKKQVIDDFNKRWQSECQKKVHRLYQVKTINRKGQKKGAFYTEILSEYLLKKGLISQLDKIEPLRKIDQKINYYTEAKIDSKSVRREENYAKMLLGKKNNLLGRYIAYQLPLKNHNDEENRGVGKIDLISYSDKKNQLSLIEFKLENKQDTLLRTLLEIETYSRLFEYQNFRQSVELKNKNFRGTKSKIIQRIITQAITPKVCKVILADESCLVVKEYRDKKRLWTHQLLRDLKIKFYVLKKEKKRLRIVER